MGLLDANVWSSDTIKNFANPGLWDCKKNSKCTPQLVERLVHDTVGADPKKLTYVAIHVVDYGSGSGNNPSNSWYLYHFNDGKWSHAKFTSQRIYGSPSLLFLFVHLNAKGLSAETVRKMGSAAPTSLSALCAVDGGAHFQPLGAGAITTDYAKVHYESAVVKRTPANIENLLNILKILGVAAQGARAECTQQPDSVHMWGAGRIDNIGLPSDVSIAGYAVAADSPMTDQDRSTKQIGAIGAFNDEPLYWWDASIGIPVHKIKDLQYSVSNNTVVASQVDKQSAYAFFNLMVHAVDLSDPKSNVWPRILVGFPLASSPWDRLFVGAGVGIPVRPLRNFQFFAGATFNRSKQPSKLSAGDPATDDQLQNDLRIKMTPKFTFGINVPVKSVLDKLLK